METEIKQIEEIVKKLELETTIIDDVCNIYIPPYVKGVKTTYGRLKYKINDKKSIKNALKELKKIKIADVLKARIKTLESIYKNMLKEFREDLKELERYNIYIMKHNKEIKDLERKIDKIDDDYIFLEILKLRKEGLEYEVGVLNEVIKYFKEIINKQSEYYYGKQDEIINKYECYLGISDYDD
jgi:DNA repair exonuclease SbcCD ATPase subunit